MPIALVTGATSGIGLAFARALAAEGHDLVLVARDKERLVRVGAELFESSGVRSELLPADLADDDAVEQFERRLREQPFDVLVNNAGFGLKRPFEENDLATELRNLDVLVRAVLRLTHAALQPMLRRGSGDIINVSSVAGFLPRGTYGANKAWVTSFSRWANVHYRRRGIRVMALCPGFVRTEFHQRLGAEPGSVPAWMWLDAEEVVRQSLVDLRAGRAVSIPGRRYQALSRLARLAPAGLVERLARRGR